MIVLLVSVFCLVRGFEDIVLKDVTEHISNVAVELINDISFANCKLCWIQEEQITDSCFDFFPKQQVGVYTSVGHRFHLACTSDGVLKNSAFEIFGGKHEYRFSRISNGDENPDQIKSKYLKPGKFVRVMTPSRCDGSGFDVLGPTWSVSKLSLLFVCST
jgi:hypothetical protein